MTRILRLVVAALLAVAITIGVSFIPEFSFNGMNPLTKGLAEIIAFACLLFASPAWLISSLLGGKGLDARGYFQMPPLGRFLLAIELTALLYAVLSLFTRLRARRLIRAAESSGSNHSQSQ